MKSKASAVIRSRLNQNRKTVIDKANKDNHFITRITSKRRKKKG